MGVRGGMEGYLNFKRTKMTSIHHLKFFNVSVILTASLIHHLFNIISVFVIDIAPSVGVYTYTSTGKPVSCDILWNPIIMMYILTLNHECFHAINHEKLWIGVHCFHPVFIKIQWDKPFLLPMQVHIRIVY